MKLAILAPTAAAAFDPTAATGQGGAERQLLVLGRALGARGHTVDLIVAADGGPVTERAGCRLWPIYPRGGVPLLKLLHPKASALLAFLRAQGSEVLLQRGAAELTAMGGLVSHLLGIGFVYAVASDSDLEPGGELLPHPQDRALYRLGLAAADHHVVQTERQRQVLRRAIGREASLLRSFPEGEPPAEPVVPRGTAILWAGNLRPVKRPEWLLTLAAAMPEQRFLVFGGAAPGHEAYAARIWARFSARPNIECLGALPPAAVPAVYGRCRVLLSTSESEGFPNTFLDAWRHGLDVVASVDPDGLLSQRALGLTAASLSGLKARLQESLTAEPGVLESRRQRAHDYLRQSHSTAVLAEAWEAILLQHSRIRTRAATASGPGAAGSPPLL